VKTPSILLPFLNRPSDILVVFDFHTFILFQLSYHPLPVSTNPISPFRFSYNFSAKPETFSQIIMEFLVPATVFLSGVMKRALTIEVLPKVIRIETKELLNGDADCLKARM
jgi:hypothetical protein